MAVDISFVKPMVAPTELTRKEICGMYKKMCQIREFDTKVREIWMAGKIQGLAHSYVGAEAVGVGACAALEEQDYITSTHRGHGHAIAKGADVKRMMAELYAKYEGYNHGKGGSMHIADVEHGMLGATGIVGSGLPIALGSALSSRVQKNNKVTVCFHGDGGANQGVWHESVNMAAAWKLPVIFLIENNQLAIATSLEMVNAQTHFYKRAAGYGIEGVEVDGFNVFDVYGAVKRAAQKAREGGGPTVIEARYVRLVGHFVADDQNYRDLKEVEQYWKYDPVECMKTYIERNEILTPQDAQSVWDAAKDEVEEAVQYAENECTEPPIETLYQDIFAHGEIIQ